MKHLLLLTLALLALSVSGQTNYEKGMQRAFDLWSNQKPEEAVNLFERIANAEPDNWLPPFYVAQIHIISSFSEKDREKMVQKMEKARNFLNDAKALEKDNAELLVLEAQLLTAWIVYDGQQYGMKYSAKIGELYQKALQLAPDNPRVVLGKAEWDMGSAQYFGQSTEPYCKDIARAIELFATFKPAGPFHPQGGGEYAQQVLERNCKE
jgi:tetratricopeptide (TPR) repeat protein